MDIPSLLNPAKPYISPRNHHIHSNLPEVGSDADLRYSLDNSGISGRLKGSHSPPLEAQRLGVTRGENVFIHCCEGHEVNEPLARLQLSNIDFYHGRPLPVDIPPGYSSTAFPNTENLSKLHTVKANTPRPRATRSRRHPTLDILPTSCVKRYNTHSYRVDPRSAGSSISSPSFLVGLRGSPIYSPCSVVAESSMDGSRSIFSASPPDHAYLSSPTSSLVAFASVAIGDYGFAKSGKLRAAEATVDNARAFSSPMELRDCVSIKPEQVTEAHRTDYRPRRLRVSRGLTVKVDTNVFKPDWKPRTLQVRQVLIRRWIFSSADEIGAANGYPYSAPTLSHFSPTQQGNAPRPRIFTFQTRIPTISSQVTDICTKKTGPQCSYTSNCSTGSPLRKVVSHIFGRNKLCTRRIPKEVWVHYCRKHYQQSRYRNPRGFALLQCDLVRKHIRRLQDWGGVTDWMIKARKSEDAEMLAADNSSVGHGREANKTNGMDGNANRTIPSSMAGAWEWLVQSTGSGKSTVDVLKILDRIEADIANSGSNFPDVEMLPNSYYR
ncbi:MAG: hypothetical protein M1816_001186 [Peltula sp. TS41687]|nr:MAG: hypothetical protein M1816_001186 [Peltula sp. TS41687]